MTTSQALALWLIALSAAVLFARAWGRRQHAIGWEEGRLYEYNRREPKRGQGGRYAPKQQDAATADLLAP